MQFLRDKDGNLWAGTNREGICLFKADGTVIKKYSKANGLPDNCICAITEDNIGNLWLSTNNGISCFNTKSTNLQKLY